MIRFISVCFFCICLWALAVKVAVHLEWFTNPGWWMFYGYVVGMINLGLIIMFLDKPNRSN